MRCLKRPWISRKSHAFNVRRDDQSRENKPRDQNYHVSVFRLWLFLYGQEKQRHGKMQVGARETILLLLDPHGNSVHWRRARAKFVTTTYCNSGARWASILMGLSYFIVRFADSVVKARKKILSRHLDFLSVHCWIALCNHVWSARHV